MNFCLSWIIKKFSPLLLLVLFLYAPLALAVSSFDLREAIDKNQVATVEKLLNEGANPQDILFLFKLPSKEICNLLLKSKANPIGPNKLLRLILGVCDVELNHDKKVFEIDNDLVTKKYELIKWLIEEENADPNEIPYFSEPPTMDLCQFLITNAANPMDPTELLELIIKSSTIINNFYKGYETIAELVARKYELVKWLIEEKNANPNKILSFSELPSLELSSLLLKNKKHPLALTTFITLIRYCRNYNNQDGLFEAKKIELFKFALNEGQNMHPFSQLVALGSDGYGLSMLMKSYANLNFKLAKLLHESGVTDDKFSTNICLAKHAENIPWLPFIHNLVTTYCTADKNFNASLESANTLSVYIANTAIPLMCYAAFNRDNELIIKMLDAGFDINIKDSLGNTPLMLAIMSGNKKGTGILLKKKADPNITNNLGMNALHMVNYRDMVTYDYTYENYALQLMVYLIENCNANSFVNDSYGINPLDTILEKFLRYFFGMWEDDNFLGKKTNGSIEDFFEKIKAGKISLDMAKSIDNGIYEFVVKKLRDKPIQNFRNDSNNKYIYIGIASTVGYYSRSVFDLATAMMAKHKDLRMKIITPEMLNEEFIQQFDGLIVPGAADNFPEDKNEFTAKDLKPDTMLAIEKLYQQVISLADKHDIPTIGICSGNQHIILYRQGTLTPVSNYVRDYDENDKSKHQGIFVPGSIPHFLTLTPNEQRKAITDCSLPSISIDISTAHHYAGVPEKLGNLKLGALSEEGVVQSVYDGARFLGFQFHPELYYKNSMMIHNRNRLLWDNFLEICRQRHRYHSYAQENGLNSLAVMKVRDKQNGTIINRLQECAEKGAAISIDTNLETCEWFYQVAKNYNLSFSEMMQALIKKQPNDAEVANVKNCMQQEPLLETLFNNNDEALPEGKDVCDRDKFQLSDYDLFDEKEILSNLGNRRSSMLLRMPSSDKGEKFCRLQRNVLLEP